MVQSFFELVLNHVFPVFCLGCKEQGEVVCDKCLQLIVFDPQWGEVDGLDVWTAFSYHDSPLLGKLIQYWKYNGNQDVFKRLWSIINLPELDIDQFIPIPLHKRRELERGFNQSLVIANQLSEKTGIPINQDLVRTRSTKKQSTMNRVQREKNLQGAFAWKGGVKRRICLVDDVFTTGQTMLTAKQCVKSENIVGFALARSER